MNTGFATGQNQWPYCEVPDLPAGSTYYANNPITFPTSWLGISGHAPQTTLLIIGIENGRTIMSIIEATGGVYYTALITVGY